MIRSVAALAIALGFASNAWCDYLKGEEAFEAGDYCDAALEWAFAAEDGHVEAQFNLGVMFGEGFVALSIIKPPRSSILSQQRKGMLQRKTTWVQPMLKAGALFRAFMRRFDGTERQQIKDWP